MKNEQIILICGIEKSIFEALPKHSQTALLDAEKKQASKSKEATAKEKDKEQRAVEIAQLNEVNKSIFQAVKMLGTAKIGTVGKDGKESERIIVTREQVKNVIKVKGFNPVQLLGVANVGQIFDKLRNGNAYSINEVYRLCEKMHVQKLDDTLAALQNTKSSAIFNIAKFHRTNEISTADAIQQLITLVGEPIKTDKEGKQTSLLSKGFAAWLYINHREEYKGLNLYAFFPELPTELQAKQAYKVATKAKDFDKTLNVDTVAKSLAGADLYTVEALTAYKAGETLLKSFISNTTAKVAKVQKVA